jgi:hypothetical protein
MVMIFSRRARVKLPSLVCSILAFSFSLNFYFLPAQALSGKASLKEIAQTAGELKVKEVTIFKEGHALMVHEGRLPLNDAGEVLIDSLPRPVLGTFFPYSLEPTLKLRSVKVGQRKLSSRRTALSVAELVAANEGAQVHLEELVGEGEAAKLVAYDAQIIGIPERSGEEIAAIELGNGEKLDPNLTLPRPGNLLQLKSSEGSHFVPLEKIQRLVFKEKPNLAATKENIANILTMSLTSGANHEGRGQSVRVGMMYLEEGLRWIPNYKLSLDGQGKAKLKLQATLINNLANLDDVSANLVVGVPSFKFKDETDPIALADILSRVSKTSPRDSSLRRSFSNAIMTQVASYSDQNNVSDEKPASSAEASKNEDLFVFHVKHLSLKRGERVVIPIEEYTLEYKDLYSLELPVLPPQEVCQQRTEIDVETQKLLRQTKVIHKIRLKNSSKHPFTTAPVLVTSTENGLEELLAQSMTSYTNPDSSCDLDLTQAIDIKAAKEEKESARIADAISFNDYKYSRINLQGKLSLLNKSSKTIALEITRKVLGTVDSASQKGQAIMLNSLEEELPPYWAYYSWPNWYRQLNGTGQFSWSIILEPGQEKELTYLWHYFWR